MKKYLQLYLATALAITSVASAEAQAATDGHKIATPYEMIVPDNQRHIVVTRNGTRFLGCTADERLVLTYVFASAYHTTVGGANKPLPVSDYLNGLVSAFQNSTRKVHSSSFNLNDRVAGVASSIKKGMSVYSDDFNEKRGTYLNWMLKAYTMTPDQSPLCK